MKNTKQTLLSIAIIAALPFNANATGPAYYSGNSPVMASTTGPYQTATIGEHDDEHIATTAYVKGAYNDTIAAVNRLRGDTSEKQDQLFTGDDRNEPIIPFVVGSEQIEDFIDHANDFEYIGVMDDYDYENYKTEVLQSAMDYAIPFYEENKLLMTFDAALDLTHKITRDATRNLETSINHKQDNLTTTVNNQSQDIRSTVAQTVNTTTPSATTLVSEAAIASAINGVTTDLSTNYATNTALNSKRVEIYTTWGVDDGTATALVPFATAQSGQ